MSKVYKLFKAKQGPSQCKECDLLNLCKLTKVEFVNQSDQTEDELNELIIDCMMHSNCNIKLVEK